MYQNLVYVIPINYVNACIGPISCRLNSTRFATSYGAAMRHCGRGSFIFA